MVFTFDQSAMLPLHQNGLSTDDEWHALKTLLVVCRYCSPSDVESSMSALPASLKSHRHIAAIRSWIDSNDRRSLDQVAAELTQRDVKDAWLLLERL
jgi:hypothetical protein